MVYSGTDTSYARTNQSQPSSGLGSMFGSNQVSYQPEGNMPADVCSTISQDLPFNTPRNQVLLANKWKKSYDNPRVFVKSILKPFKGFEGVFEYTFDKNMYDYNFYTGKTQYTDIQGGNNIWNAAKDYLQKENSSPITMPSIFMVHISLILRKTTILA